MSCSDRPSKSVTRSVSVLGCAAPPGPGQALGRQGAGLPGPSPDGQRQEIVGIGFGHGEQHRRRAGAPRSVEGEVAPRIGPAEQSARSPPPYRAERTRARSSVKPMAPTRQPARRYRHSADTMPCAGPWPRPRWATTATAKTPPYAASRRRYAELIGKEASLFVPSGTMGHRWPCAWASPGRVLIPGSASIVNHEGGGFGLNQVRCPLDDDDGALDPVIGCPYLGGSRPLRAAAAVVIEDTHMARRGRLAPRSPGGRWPGSDCPCHLDGARLFNAEVATGPGRSRRPPPPP